MQKAVGKSLPGQTGFTHRILVADDEEAIRRLIATVLGGSGFQVDTAENGAVAWEMLQAGGYDLLITDNSMPVMSGVELIKTVRTARIALPIIMATGTMPARELTEDPPFELSALLLKPYAMATLVKKVKEILHEAVPTSSTS